MNDFSQDKIPLVKERCPYCGANTPEWSYHGSYERFLISYENNIVTDIIYITVLICSSCKHTHAILPEIIIPHSSYSLLFILRVLKDYFIAKMTIKAICEKYHITVSMLYRWKQLFLIHKKLWLGVMEDMYTNSIALLESLPSTKASEELSLFFKENACSFLQGVSKIAHFNSS